ncbi:MAG: hypothetical protein KDK76_04755 [Chlamydiia bacterium]|nr:hypothetical protein [Chlamydiia bacterium]
MKLSTRSAILFSGLVWLALGILLLSKGMKYLVFVGSANPSGILIKQVSRLGGDPHQGALILICLSLVLGLFKGRVVMKKAVNRVVERIRSFPSPIPLSAIYSKGYLFLIGGMTLMGISFKFLPLSIDIKGFIDCAVGAALINGAMLYIRAAYEPVRS